MMEERRKRTRVPVTFDDIYILYQEDKIKVKTFNISLTGISCTSNPLFRVNENCRIILTLNEDTSLEVAGKILRVDEKEAIIAFHSMDEDTFFHLKRIIEYNAVDADQITQEIKNPAFSRP
ncbi:MAG: PilZ domain-containing protein [Smithella sp.]